MTEYDGSGHRLGYQHPARTDLIRCAGTGAYTGEGYCGGVSTGASGEFGCYGCGTGHGAGDGTWEDWS